MSDDEGPGYKIAADGHKYHKSATANATTAPTNEATKENAAKTKGLSSKEAEFVTIIDYEWHLKGNLDAESLKEEYGYTDKEYGKLQANVAVLHALKERGISPKAVAPDSELAKEAGRSKLTPIQLIVANAVLDLVDTRPLKKKLADMNVSPYQYQSWLKDPEFSHYLRERAEGLLGDVQHEAALALVDKVMSGDMNAIKYYNEMTGRFIPQSSSSGQQSSSHDLQSMIVRIIEIIVDEVDDPMTAAKIADRLKGLVMGHQIVSAISEPITMPEIAPARILTAETQALMNKGVGVNE